MLPAQKSTSTDGSPHSTRASVSFPSDLYQALEALARQKRVSVAWVVRDAAERYVAVENPREESSNVR